MRMIYHYPKDRNFPCDTDEGYKSTEKTVGARHGSSVRPDRMDVTLVISPSSVGLLNSRFSGAMWNINKWMDTYGAELTDAQSII